MGLLDGLLKQAMGGQSEQSGLSNLMGMVASNPQILGAVSRLLSSRDSSVGGAGGLAGLLPSVIDHLTPDGKLPETNSLEVSLESLLSGIGG